ncbi:MAG: protein-disulfide reductase DsbD N-terminal domain-containing protein [Ancalomicrobiaceae bacterium]|nr:protein-disulfide reductase DsbD N-terminal domain-containing protein [Ancalomicrobiaceae bacterium]
MRLSHLPISAAVFGALLSAAAASPAVPPTADEVFRLTAKSDHPGSLLLSWTMAPGTYLYRDRISATLSGRPLDVRLEPGTIQDDPVFGPTEIYRGHIEAWIGMPASVSGDRLTVSYQGCAEHTLCYPPVVKSVDLKTLQVSDALD